MLSVAILGFLAEEPLHAYELKARIAGLTGHVRPVSDGALYPAINRLRRADHVTRHTAPGTGAVQRQVLTITEGGRVELRRRLRDPKDVEITDRDSFVVLLAFLGQLPDSGDQAGVLRRRLEFLDRPASFYEGKWPPTSSGPPDRLRRAMLGMTGEMRKVERRWLAETLVELESSV